MKKAKVIAYYLPQYHPTSENDAWWGKGYTEWTTVAKARPLFKGHVQPKIPADLGFYDLRLPIIREQQAELAKEAGIDAFCYWHYWFGNGIQLLEKPLQEVVSSGKPDFPFCLGWANHTWHKKIWNSDVSRLDQTVLMEMNYPGVQDYEDHFYKMLPTFQDKRYYKIDGRLVFLIYVVRDIPELDEFFSTWQNLARKNGLPPFYFIGHINDEKEMVYARQFAFDHLVLENHFPAMSSKHMNVNRAKTVLSMFFKKPLSVYKYADFISKLDYHLVEENNDIFPTVYPNWDTSPRRGAGGKILIDATPELFKNHVNRVLDILKDKDEQEKVIFLKSWNEWGEGNYMEPDLEFGKQRIQALHDALYD